MKVFGGDDYLVSKKVSDEATDIHGDADMMKIKKLCAKEEAFSTICSHHLLKQHAGARTTQELVKKSFFDLCLSCKRKDGKSSCIPGYLPWFSYSHDPSHGAFDL